MALKHRRVGVRRVEACEARRRQTVACRLPLRLRHPQTVTKRHQFIDLGHDTVLLGKGWEGDRDSCGAFLA